MKLKDGSSEKVKYNIAVSHELIHSDHNRLGVRDNSDVTPLDRRIKTKEELRTIQRENNIRLENKLKIRYDGNHD